MYRTFLENDEPNLLSQIRDTIAKVCEDSALAAAGNKQLQAYDVHMYYVDLGDSNVMYYLDEEASRIATEAGIAIASAKESTDLPEDAGNILSTRHYRF